MWPSLSSRRQAWICLLQGGPFCGIPLLCHFKSLEPYPVPATVSAHLSRSSLMGPTVDLLLLWWMGLEYQQEPVSIHTHAIWKFRGINTWGAIPDQRGGNWWINVSPFILRTSSSQMHAIGPSEWPGSIWHHSRGQPRSTSLCGFPPPPFHCLVLHSLPGTISHINYLHIGLCLRTWDQEKLSWDRQRMRWTDTIPHQCPYWKWGDLM